MELGALATINVDENDTKKQLIELTKQRGFNVAIKCADVGISLNNCIHLLPKQGLLNEMGLFGKKIEFNSDFILMKEH